MGTLKVKILYQIEDDKKWYCQEILPDEYFDLEEGELVNIDSVPIYNHAINYSG